MTKVLLRLAQILDVVMSHPLGWDYAPAQEGWISGEAGGSPSVLGSLASPSHLEVVCERWTADPHLPSVSYPFLRVWAGLGPLKP